MSEALVAAHVRVPCSTSNLGSGYDTIGLALDRYLDVTFDPARSGGVVLQREGSLAVLSDDDGPDLVQTTFEEALAKEGVHAHGVLRLCSDIPISRGLGSSSTAVLAGFDLARAVRGEPRADEKAFKAALKYEGHGDNAAPSLYGGLRAVVTTADGAVVIGLKLSESIGFAYAAPAMRLRTDAARDALPKQVPHKTAASSLGRIAALIRGLAEGRPDLVRIGVKDDLHVPYRLPMIPNAASAMSSATDAGAWAVTISGAGSGLIAMCEPERAGEVAEAMRVVLAAGNDDPECVGFAVRPDHVGLRRIED
ncbi:MAG: homoserine kinase [Gemmatimonadota bacterium]|jgi:homoserine kinase